MSRLTLKILNDPSRQVQGKYGMYETCPFGESRMWCLETLVQINQEAAKDCDYRDVYARRGIKTGDGPANVKCGHERYIGSQARLSPDGKDDPQAEAA